MSNADHLIGLFSQASARPAGAERECFLAETCRGDPELKRQVLSLLDAQDRAGAFLASPLGKEPILATEQPGGVIGTYILRDKLGEGGCGVVYVAEQEKPVRRFVALKVIKLGMDTKAVVARFEAERQALAVMDHPNIAKVLEAGATDTGRPYFVMELVEGTRITDYCEQNRLGITERIELFIQVCNAIQHAHQKGIIHRDIKPSNILVTLHDAVPMPKVIDFGIAKATQGRLTEATVHTHLHQFIGTPAYMSPEQAEMCGADIDTRTDIYSLGVLLYELLVGCTPFDAKELTASGVDGMRRTIREVEPVRPSTRLAQALHRERFNKSSPRVRSSRPRIDSDLDWIVMRCLEKDRKRRYETANGLAADLKRFLGNAPVEASPPSYFDRIRKAFRRQKVLFTASSLVALSLVFVMLAAVWQVVKVNRAQVETERKSYVSAMNLARQAWDDHDLGRLRRLLEETAGYRDRGFEWYYWQRQTHLDLGTLRGHLGPVVHVSFSPMGERVLTASLDGTARIWDSHLGTELRKFAAHQRGVTSADWSPDGRHIVTASEDRTAATWDTASGALLLRWRGHSDGLTAARYSPDGRHILTGSRDRTSRLWRTDTGRQVLQVIHGAEVCSVDFSPDGQRIVTAGNDEIAIVWHAATGEKLVRIQAPSAQIKIRRPHPATFYAAFSPDGDSIVTISQNQTANLWDARTGVQISRINGNTHWLSPRQYDLPLAGSFSPDGKRLIMGGLDFSATVWRLADQTSAFHLKGHEAEVVSVAFSPGDGNRVVTGSYDHTAKIWSAKGATETLPLGEQKKIIPGSAFSPRGDRIVTVSLDGTAMVRHAETGEPLLALNHGDVVWCVAYSPDPEGARIVTGTQNGSIVVWNAVTGGELLRIDRGHAREIHTIQFSKDGKRILSAGKDGTSRLWDALDGREIRRFELNQPFVFAAFSPDSRRIVMVCSDNIRTTREKADAVVRDAETGQTILSLNGHGNGFSAVAYSPDGRFIVTGSIDWTASVWDASTGKEKLSLKGHHDQVISLAVSPDSRRIFTGGFDLTTRVWDATHGEEMLTLKGGLIEPPGLSSDGRRFVTGPGPPATVWSAASTDQIERWQTEERLAAKRLAAQRRESAAPIESNDALNDF